jgi:hypothetical protein
VLGQRERLRTVRERSGAAAEGQRISYLIADDAREVEYGGYTFNDAASRD